MPSMDTGDTGDTLPTIEALALTELLARREEDERAVLEQECMALRDQLSRTQLQLDAALTECGEALENRTRDRANLTVLRRKVADLELHNHGLRMIVASLSRMER